MEDVDFSGLGELFRERLFRMMVRRGKISPETVDNMKSWPHCGFHLDFQRKVEADDRKGLEGLLSYFERAPVSLRRLTYRDDGMVHYQGTQLHPRLGVDHQVLTPSCLPVSHSPRADDPHRRGGARRGIPAHSQAQLGASDRQGVHGGPLSVRWMRSPHGDHLRHQFRLQL